MAPYVVVAIEGVLARPVERATLSSAMPIPEGTRLYLALKKVFKVALVTLENDEIVAEHWLARNGLKGHTSLWGRIGLVDEPAQIRAEQLMELRARGHALDLFVDANPKAVARAVGLGVTGLVFASPAYARPEFRPDAALRVRPWDELAEEVGRQNELRAREPVPTADLHE
jgi:hypothetical protein